MHKLATKPKAAQQIPSEKSAEPSRSLFGQSRNIRSILHLQRTIGNQAIRRLLQSKEKGIQYRRVGSFPRELTPVVCHRKAEPDILMRDFRQTSVGGDTLEVVTTLLEPDGRVRFRAAAGIITTEGDRIPYQVRAEITNRPFNVIIGVRFIANGEVIRQQSLIRNPSHRNLRHWEEGGSFRIPRFSASGTPGSDVELFVRLEPNGADPVEYSNPLSLDMDRSVVELARIFQAEAGGSLVGMSAIAHTIQNRLSSGCPPAQIDTVSPWPTNFINTGFWLNRGRPRTHWPTLTSTASRSLAQIIIENEGPTGNDPTYGALFYRAASRPELERTHPAFIRLAGEVRRGTHRRIEVEGNVFYSPVEPGC